MVLQTGACGAESMPRLSGDDATRGTIAASRPRLLAVLQSRHPNCYNHTDEVLQARRAHQAVL
jgi:hypothetical protein